MKQINVIGATGYVGSALVEEAIQQDISINALVRNVSKINQKHSYLALQECDIEDVEAIKKSFLIDVPVIVSIATSTIDQKLLLMKNIIQAMKSLQMNRILVVGGAGILPVNSNQKLYETEQFPLELLGFTLGHLGVYELLKKSALQYTMVCPPNIPDIPYTGNYTTSINQATGGWSINRGDLAHFIVQSVFDNQYHDTIVGIANM